jgi:internalin A
MGDDALIRKIEAAIGEPLQRMTCERAERAIRYRALAALELDGKGQVIGLWFHNKRQIPIQVVARLQALTDLVLDDCGVTTLAPLASLSALTYLRFDNNQVSDLTPLASLSALRRLSFNNNQVSDLTPLALLSALTRLSFNNNQVSDLTPLTSLSALTCLWFDNNQVSDLAPLASLSALAELWFRHNQVSDLAPLASLPALTWLWFENNQVSDLAPLASLFALTSLWFENNQVSDLAPLASLSALLDLSFGKNHVSDLAPLAKLERLRTLGLANNPIESPPPDVAAQGPAAIRSYFALRARQRVGALLEAKVLFVGQPGAGKTSLIRKLLDPAFVVPQPEQPSTLGIDVLEGWEFPWHRDRSHKLRAHLWDFGGQNIQYYLHQFFLTQHSLYILVLDDRKDCENVDYWFDVIELLGDGCPVLVVENEKECHGATGFSLERARYEQRYSERLKLGFFRVDLKRDDERLGQIRDAAERALSGLEHMGELLPAGWIAVRERVKEIAAGRAHIAWAEYAKICGEADIPDERDQLVLSERLHNLGVLLHYQDDPELSDTVFLDPQWVTRAMYTVLADQRLVDQGACFSQSWLFEKWGDQYGHGDKGLLLRLMQKRDFDLCYRLPSDPGRRRSLPPAEERYLVPQLLRNAAPAAAHDWPAANCLRYRYTYPFMPEGILTRLSVRLAEKIHRPGGTDLIWRNGVILEQDGARALVERGKDRDGRQTVNIAVQGPRLEAQQLLGTVRGELGRLHKTGFRRLPFEQWIPCSCERCQSAVEPTLFEVGRLKTYVAQNRSTITCEHAEGFNDVPIVRLLEGVLPPRPQKVRNAADEVEELVQTGDDLEALLAGLGGGGFRTIGARARGPVVIAPQIHVAQVQSVQAPEAPPAPASELTQWKDRFNIAYWVVGIVVAVIGVLGVKFGCSSQAASSPPANRAVPAQGGQSHSASTGTRPTG